MPLDISSILLALKKTILKPFTLVFFVILSIDERGNILVFRRNQKYKILASLFALVLNEKRVGLKRLFGISQSYKICPDAPMDLNQNIALVPNSK